MVHVLTRIHPGRPVVRVRPRNRIPDTTTPEAQPERESTIESDEVDVESVEMEGEESSTDGWEEGAANPLS